MSLKQGPSSGWPERSLVADTAPPSPLRILAGVRPLPLLLGLALALPLFATQLFDDLYIHARIAVNLLEHGYPAFNPGDQFKASSSTGYVIVLALASLVLDPVVAVRAIEAGVIAATIAAFGSLAAALDISRLKLALAGAVALPAFLVAAYGGMESSIACLSWTLAAGAAARRDDRMTTLYCALAVWFRFEAVLLLALVLYCRLRRDDLKLLACALPALLLFALEWALYGTVVPHALEAKSTAYAFPLSLSVTNALGLGEKGALRSLAMAGTALLLVTTVPAAVRLVRRRGEVAFGEILLLFSGVLLCAWMVSRTLIFPWYYCLLFFPLGLYALLAPRVPAPASRWRRWTSALAMLILAAIGLVKANEQIGVPGHPSPNARVLHYLKIGSALYAHCPGCTLLSAEIGGLGYRFKGRFYDALGLADPQALRFHPLKVPQERQHYSVGAIPPSYAELRDPDLIVSMPLFARALIGSTFIKRYRGYDCPFDPQFGTIWGHDKIRVFSKAPLPVETLAAMGCRAR